MTSPGGGDPRHDNAIRLVRSWLLPVGNPIVLISLVGLYVLAGKIVSVPFADANASAVWPPAGIALAALLTLGYRSWPAVFAGAFIVSLTSAGSLATSLGIAAGNTLEALLGAYLVNRFASGIGAFDRAPDVFRFGLAAVLSTAVGATIGVASLALGGHARWDDLDRIWLTWWLGDGVGALIVAPLVILWLPSMQADGPRRCRLETASLFASTILIGLVVFGDATPLGLTTYPPTFLCAPPLIWAAVRFRPREAAALIALLAGIATWETLRGSGPFASAPWSESPLLLQAFLGTVAVMILPAAALVEERRRVEQDREELLTSAQAARAEAEAAGRAKDEFLAMFSHELRNPLATMISAVTVLDRIGGPEDLAERARAAIRHQITHLSRLVDELLDVACVTRGTIVLACQPVNLAASVQRSVSVLVGTGRLLRHVLDVEADPVWVHGDPARLDQIVSNLLANAARYTPPGGTIRVRVGGLGGEAVVRVEDTGIGIPPHLLSRIFDVFVEGQRGLGGGQDGLGVGLTMVRHLVGLHGGQVAAFSEGPGRGSEFVVRLPRIQPVPAAPEPVATATAAVSAGERRRILIVEDNTDARKMLRLALELAGHEVEVAEEGHTALALAASRWPEVVLIDIGLPGMDGYEVARRLRATSGYPEIRLLAITGYGQAQESQRSRAAGFDAHLVKPVDPDEVARVIRQVASAQREAPALAPDRPLSTPVDNPVGKGVGR